MLEKSNLPSLKTRLFGLNLDRVDLVHTGSNTRADILLKKGKEQENMPKTYEELLALLKPEQQDVLKSHIATIEKSIADKDAAIADLTGRLETLEKAAPAPAAVEMQSEETILKGAAPEIVAHVEKMQKQVAELLDREANNIAKARFETVKAIPCEAEQLMEVLKTASPTVVEILQKAAKAVEESVLTAKGKDTEGAFSTESSSDIYAKLEKMAQAKVAEEKITFEKAFTAVCSANGEMYAAYLKGVK